MKAQGQGAGTFNIGPSTGIVKLAKELDFEDLRQPHIYQLLVTATEDSGGFSTSVELTIKGQIFWEGHKNLKESPTCFAITKYNFFEIKPPLSFFKKMLVIFSNFFGLLTISELL